MNHKQTPDRVGASGIARLLFATLAAFAIAPAAQAQLTDISSNPLTTSQPNQVKPNLLFILDDSGSMARTYMPDDVNDLGANAYGRNAAQCNGLAYNPSTTYRLPVDATGADHPPGTYTFPLASDLNNIRTITLPVAPSIATGLINLTLSGGNGPSNGTVVTLYSNTDQSLRMIGNVTAGGGTTALTVNVTETQGSGSLTNPRLATGDNRPFYFTYSGSSTPLSYTYNTSGVITTTNFYRDCNTNIGSNPASGATFTKVVVTPSNITQNYRDWYTYYRTRLLMAKSATSLAFRPIGDRFRVGFTTISSTRVSGTNFLDVSDFDAGQKGSFHTSLFNATAPSGNYTPLRGALAKAGKYYAKKATRADGSAQSYDPVQFSCQKNFAILTTDGYWNIDDEVTGTTSSSYGPDKLDNTDVGQQDGTAPRPMLDGATSVTQTRSSDLQQRSVSGSLMISTSNLQSRTRTLFEERSFDGGGSWQAPTAVASCTWDTNGGNRRRCSYATSWSAWSDVGSCTANALDTGTSNGTTWETGVQCQYTAWTTPVTTGSCTAQAQDLTSPHTVGVARQCTLPVYGAWTNTATCTVSATNECRYTGWTGWTNTASCTAAPQSTAPTYTVGTARECQTVSSGGVSNTLADVAMYYYNTDLRDTALNNCTLASGTNVCTNNVPPRGTDTVTHQHMSTFTVGMGVNGTLAYASNYLTGGSADYNAIVQGTKDWPTPGDGVGAPNIDDLWHAAVNGRGQYFSAGDPSTLARGLSDALAAIEAQSGSGSGAAASTLQPVAGDNSLFIAKYTTVEWTGDLVSRTIDPQSGVIASTDTWSARTVLDARVAAGTARNIYYAKRDAGANTGALRSFTYANLSTDGLNGNFDNVCSKTVPLTQCSDGGYDVAGANSGANMVAWLRGSYDVRYRLRQHILGDTTGGAAG